MKSLNWIELLIVIATWGALYYQFLKPFDPSVHLSGRYKLAPNPIGNRIYQTAITFGINFTNSGARIGFIDDLLLKFSGPNGGATYIAAFEDLNETISFPVSATPQLKELKYSPSTAFAVPAHTSITKEIFFVPYDHTTPRLVPGEYTVFMHIKYSKNEMYKKALNTKIILEPADYEGFPPSRTFEEAQDAYKKPYALHFFTRSKILPEKDELIKKMK